MKKIVLSCAMLVSIAFAGGAQLYKPCITCHGKKAEKVALGKSKILANLSVAEIVRTMNGYKDGTYGGPLKGIMKGQVSKLSKDDIQVLAEYVQTIK